MFLPSKTCSGLALLGAAITLATAGSAFATVIASDQFNYPAGAITTGAWNGGTGWNGAWVDNSGTVTYDPVIGSDGRLHTESASTGDRHKGVIRTLASSQNLQSAGTIWGSVNMSVTNMGETTQYAWLSLMLGGAETVRFGRIESNPTKWGVQQSAYVGGTNVNSTVVLGAMTSLVFKMQYVGTNSVYSLWINPGGAGEANLGTPDATLTRAGNLTFDGIRLQSRASATFDDFVIGTTFADVVIPEPSSALSSLMGAGLLLIRKRRVG